MEDIEEQSVLRSLMTIARSIVPNNIVRAAVEYNILVCTAFTLHDSHSHVVTFEVEHFSQISFLKLVKGVLVFAMAIGFTLLQMRNEKSEIVLMFFQGMNDVIMNMLRFVIW